MRKICLSISAFISFFFYFNSAYSQTLTNKGKDFWAGFYRTSSLGGAGSVMKIYMVGGNVGDSVQIAINEGSPNAWITKYFVPANTVVSSDMMPDSIMTGDGLYAKSAIHITSSLTDIGAFVHIYQAQNSGSCLLMPTNAWGYENYVLSSRQNFSVNQHSVFHIIANNDSTWVEVNPSKPTVGGWTTNGGTQLNRSYLIKLNKGDAYQVLGGIISGSEGFDLTGSSVQSIPNAQGVRHPITVFCGSSRTNLGCGTVAGSTGDIIFQQAIPYKSWGLRYATTPYNNFAGPNSSSNQTTIYRIMVNDASTVVFKNGVPFDASSLVNGRYYQYESNTADYIEADKPVLLGEYMASTGSCTNTGPDGDPEMIYISSLEKGIKKASFFRTGNSSINSNYVTLIIPTNGLSSLKIDGTLLANITAGKYSYAHPKLPGYSVVVRKWAATEAQCDLESDSAFTGITYGLGYVESYGYNIGSYLDSNTLLPLKLLAFSAKRNGTTNLLLWQTSQEINTDHFDIERSPSGKDFSKIGRVKTGTGVYTFTDQTSLPLLNYYRLKMVDKDGRSAYSKIVSLQTNGIARASIFPNPVSSSATLQVWGDHAETVMIKMVNANGKVLSTKTSKLFAGNNQILLDMQSFSTGVYMVFITGQRISEQYKLSKQ